MSRLPTIKNAGGFRIPKFGPGRNAIVSRNANDLVDALNALGHMRIVRDETATEDKIVYSDGGIVFALAIAGITSGGGGSVKVVKIVTAPANSTASMTCIELSGGVETGANFSVAKPTYLRSLSGNQYAFPSYEADDLLLAMFVQGGIGSSIEWVDLNIDGRLIGRETVSCDDEGGTVYSIIPRTPWTGTAVGSDFT